MADAEETKPSRFELLLEYYLNENRKKRAEDEAKRVAALGEGPRVPLSGEDNELFVPKAQGRREQFEVVDAPRPRPRPPVSFGNSSQGDQPFVPPTPPVFGSGLFTNSQWDTVPNQDGSRLKDDGLRRSVGNVQTTTEAHESAGNEDLEREEPSATVKRRHCTCSVGKSCELAAEKGVEDCRSVVPEKTIRRKPSMANPL